MRDCEFEELSHPPYSSDFALCDLHLFPNLKGHLRGKHFENDNELKDNDRRVVIGARQNTLFEWHRKAS